MTDYNRLFAVGILAFFTVSTFKDLCVQTSSDKQIPISKVSLGSNIGPTLKFLYCYSCGYRKLFDDYSNIIREKYPQISVQGGNYDPPGYLMMVAKFLGLGKMLLILCIISGVNVFEKLGMQAPSWWFWCTDNKIYSCLMLFFMCNAIEGHLVSTGAFEIMFNDMPVWSKLETGRIPQPPELFQIIDNQLRLDDVPSFEASDYPK